MAYYFFSSGDAKNLINVSKSWTVPEAVSKSKKKSLESTAAWHFYGYKQFQVIEFYNIHTEKRSLNFKYPKSLLVPSFHLCVPPALPSENGTSIFTCGTGLNLSLVRLKFTKDLQVIHELV